MWQSLKTVFKAIWGKESKEEIEKDKEIEYERNQWGFPNGK